MWLAASLELFSLSMAARRSSGFSVRLNRVLTGKVVQVDGGDEDRCESVVACKAVPKRAAFVSLIGQDAIWGPSRVVVFIAEGA